MEDRIKIVEELLTTVLYYLDDQAKEEFEKTLSPKEAGVYMELITRDKTDRFNGKNA